MEFDQKIVNKNNSLSVLKKKEQTLRTKIRKCQTVFLFSSEILIKRLTHEWTNLSKISEILIIESLNPYFIFAQHHIPFISFFLSYFIFSMNYYLPALFHSIESSLLYLLCEMSISFFLSSFNVDIKAAAKKNILLNLFMIYFSFSFSQTHYRLKFIYKKMLGNIKV